MASSVNDLPLIQQNQSGKEITANNLISAGSPAMLFGFDSSGTAGLNLKLMGGTLLNNSTGALAVIAAPTVALTASATNYVESTVAGVVSRNTVGFTTGRIRIGIAETGATTITAWTDSRAFAFALQP